ncbi:MAG: pyridoxamine 5'-phosphate oxidase family protein [Anaerovoracaceae bacterium]|nr:pyridoxamine 5'-phosphate oxidase family protein [Anaerovoracaceae bacterium]
MFREMKRKERQLSAELTEKILNKCTSGVLSVIGDDGYPYGVPVSYAYSDGKIFFHCAKEGHKVDAIKNNPKVSFTVIAQDDVVPEAYGTDFASVIAFGKASFVEDPEEMLQSHIPIIEKYSNEYYDGGIEYFNKAKAAMRMVRIDIEHITGKGKGVRI